MQDEKPAAPSDDEAILKELRDRLAACIKHSAEDRQESAEDHSFFGGNQWPNEMRKLRQVEARPCLTINKLPSFLHQVMNDQRQNRPSIKVHPVDSGADPEVAEVIQGAIRYIEYNSNADIAYDTAVAHATIGGFGYFRLVTEYVSETSFDQEIRFRRVQNPFSVYIDPFSQEPDGSDMMFCFVTELVSKTEFRGQYPKATLTGSEGLNVGQADTQALWLTDDSIRIAEYYRISTKRVTLCRLSDGSEGYKEDLPKGLPDGIEIVKERQTEKRTVEWFKCTGMEVLERTEIPCKWIPVFPVYGEEHVIDGKIKRNGMVRWARDPQRMYNFWMTSATEEVSLRPKTPFIGAVGQFETAKKDWKQANNKSFAFLEYDPIEVNGIQAPAPQRQGMADVPTGVLAMAMHASDNIKATTGIFDASLGAQGNETSGRAITARQKEGDTANFHYADNETRTIRHAGRCIVNMLPKVYDTPRIMRILGADEKMDMVPVNTPNHEGKPDDSGAIKAVLNDLTVGQYDVTIGVGPSYTTQRAEAVDAMMQVGQAYPTLWQVAGDKIVRSMDWPGADEIADRLEKTLPPGIAEEKDDQQQQQLPPQVTQALQQVSQEIQQLQQQLQQSESGMAAKQLDAQVKVHLAEQAQKSEQARLDSQERIAAMNNDTKHEIAELQGMVQMLLQKMQPPPALAADVNADLASEPKEEKPQPDAVALLGQLVSAMNPPKRKRLSITAPSGAVYQGDISEELQPQEVSDGNL
jgi:hypothetical protein